MDEPIQHPRENSAPPIDGHAPNFSLPDETGTLHTLADALMAGKPLVLIFMRGEW